MEIIYINNRNYLLVEGLQNISDDTYLNDTGGGEAVTITVQDADGNAVSGQVFPATMTYVTGSNGNWDVTLSASLALTKGVRYDAVLNLDDGTGSSDEIIKPLRAMERRV